MVRRGHVTQQAGPIPMHSGCASHDHASRIMPHKGKNVRKLLYALVLLIGPAWVIAQPVSPEVTPKQSSILIQGGTVVDGTGARRRRAGVPVAGEGHRA